jgi:type VI secretion system protein ImpF
MAELTPFEKLQPCLLDRLTDDEPNKQQESRMKRVMSLQRYRQAVLRDLAWLLNTYANAEQQGLDDFEEVPSSVLNYGIQNVAGMTASSVSADEIRYRLTEAIQRFEPRIIPKTISITINVNPEEMTRRSVRFEIRGDLWSQPLPESLFIATELDLETGKTKLTGG